MKADGLAHLIFMLFIFAANKLIPALHRRFVRLLCT